MRVIFLKYRSDIVLKSFKMFSKSYKILLHSKQAIRFVFVISSLLYSCILI